MHIVTSDITDKVILPDFTPNAQNLASSFSSMHFLLRIYSPYYYDLPFLLVQKISNVKKFSLHFHRFWCGGGGKDVESNNIAS